MADSRKLPCVLLLLINTIVLLGTACVGGVPAAELELYGTFHAMGVIVTLDPGDDPDEDAVARVEYRVHDGGLYREGLSLSRIAPDRFVGSLFWLEPGRVYDARIAFEDPDGALHGVVLETTAPTRSEIEIPPPNRSLITSPTGGGGDCTEGFPCALAYALEEAVAGDEVVLRGGVYYEGEFDLPRSGHDGAPIVLRGYESETAILDGSDPETAGWNWAPVGGGVYFTTTNVADTHLIYADGERLFPYESLADLEGLVWDGLPGFFADGFDLYLHLAGGADPSEAEVAVSRFNYAFLLQGRDFIYFIDITFRHYGQGSWAKSLYLRDASDNLVRGCTFAHNDLGIGIKYDSHRNVIEESEFYDAIFDWPWDAVKTVGRLEDGGISFYDPVDGRGNVIRRNVFHDDFDGFGVNSSSSSSITNETDAYENVVYRMGDDGLETDGRASNVRIWGNRFYDVLMGISMAPTYDGPTYAIRNLIYRTGVGNNTYTGSPFKFNSGYDQSGPMFLFHNTGDAFYPNNNGLYIKAPGSWTGIVARNNVWSGTDYAIHNYNTDQPVDLDYDDLWNGQTGPLVRWDGTIYETLNDFAAATGQESHGLSVDPEFLDPPGGDYSLDSTSDLIDQGLMIPGINDDFAGVGPDVGAFEYRPGTEAADEPMGRPIGFRCRPNPFVSSTVVRYRLERETDVDLSVFDPAGRRVELLVAGVQGPGVYTVAWDGRDRYGRAVGTGVYFIRARIGEGSETARAVRVE